MKQVEFRDVNGIEVTARIGMTGNYFLGKDKDGRLLDITFEKKPRVKVVENESYIVYGIIKSDKDMTASSIEKK
jgi:hypothetical protein